jgi:hypothetical protein
MFSFFGSNKSNDADCKEITNLSESINANINIISGFLEDNGFITDVQKKLTVIQGQIREFKQTQTAVTIVSNELKSVNPDCTKALAELNALRKLISEKDANIAKLKQDIQDLQRSQTNNATQSEIIKKQNDCTKTCTDILRVINNRLITLVNKFNQSQQNINKLLDDISVALLSPNGPATDNISGVNPMNTRVDIPRNRADSTTDAINVLEPTPVTRGGYYYPTSSSSKRNKKSIGRRKKHKRTNKTRR